MTALSFVEITALSVSLLIAISIIHYTLRYGISPMPSSGAVRRDLLPLLPKLDSGEIFELGSGFGTLAIPLARQYPNLQVTGFEISPVPYWIATLRAKSLGLTNLHFVRKDFLLADLTRPRLLVSYLYPGGMNKIAQKLSPDSDKKQYFLSHTFALPGYEPIQSTRASDLYRSPIYLYELNQDALSPTSGEA